MTLADLELAIANYELTHRDYELAAVWRAVSEWLNRFAITNFDEDDPAVKCEMRAEYAEGMALIREKLL